MQPFVTSLKATGTRMADHAARSGSHFALHHHLLLGLVVCASAWTRGGRQIITGLFTAPPASGRPAGWAMAAGTYRYT